MNLNAGSPWKPIGDKVYQIITEPKSFDDAAKHCIQIRGKLFEPKTEKENNDVMKFLNLAALCSGWQPNARGIGLEFMIKTKMDNSNI